MMGTESRSWTSWRVFEQGHDYPLPPVLFFEDQPPDSLLESGVYVSFEDFKDVMRSVGTTPEPLANLYHTLVLFFSSHDRRLHTQAEAHLRYNPTNQASWNRAAWTYKYYLLTELINEFSAYRVDHDHKIAGVGTKGRRIMRAVIDAEISFDET